MQIRHRVLDINCIARSDVREWPCTMYIAIKSTRIPPGEPSEHAICRTTDYAQIFDTRGDWPVGCWHLLASRSAIASPLRQAGLNCLIGEVPRYKPADAESSNHPIEHRFA